MSWLNYYIEKMKNGIITFINMVSLANRDYPYHDYNHADENTTKNSYAVGYNQIDAHGDQHKQFVSKSTLLYSTENRTVHFNDQRNVAVLLLANTWYEFKSNIKWLCWDAVNTDKDFYMYFEGVLPEEQRHAE